MEAVDEKNFVNVTMHIPREELLKAQRIAKSFAENAKQYIPNATQRTEVRTPNPTAILLSFAYRELRVEAREARGFAHSATKNSKVVGDWGKVKVPDWVFNKKSTITINFVMSKIAYNKIISWIDQLYPKIFANNSDKNDFIAALGAAYAERILAGQIEVNGEIVGMS